METINEINILIVDDNPGNLLALESILNSPDYRLYKAENGTEALRLILHEDFSLVILDVHMPGIDGFEVANQIKGRDKTKHIPIIFLTGTVPEDDKRTIFRGYSTGAIDFLTKPVDPIILKSKVSAFIEMIKKERELDSLNKKLETTQAELQKSFADLKDLNESLEKKVLERTEKLQEAYNKLKETQQLAMEQEKLKILGQISSGIAHDINNALSPILGYTQFLLATESNLNENTIDSLKLIETSANDIANIVRRMQEFYRKRGENEELMPVDLNLMVKQAIDLTKPRWKDIPQQKGILINCKIDLYLELRN